MKRYAYITAFTAILLLLGFALASPAAGSPPSPAAPTPSAPQDESQQALQAIQQAVSANQAQAPVLLLFDTQVQGLALSEDQSWAKAWLVSTDLETGEAIPGEPGLALARRDPSGWQALLPSDPGWLEAIKTAPDSLLPGEARDYWLQMFEAAQAPLPQAPLGGYLLPWAGGRTKYATQTTGHDRYNPGYKAHYAFDFADGTMFEVFAAKGGVVVRARWTCKNGDENCTNYLVLEDNTTNPTTYPLYLHFAQDSIPEAYRTAGAYVPQGALIGLADDTGVSTGHHLHFMVVNAKPTSFWGSSVDIIFDDVPINGGRPRILSDRPYCYNNSTFQDVCDVFQKSYVSGNRIVPDNDMPQGGITAPLPGAVADAGTLALEGWATDATSGIAKAQFRANWDGAWQDIGAPFIRSPFSLEWDLCAAGVPDGPVALALSLRDNAGNSAGDQVGLRYFTKNFTCPPPPPACVPGSDKVAIFADPDRQGECVVLDTDSALTDLGNLGADSAASIQVGSSMAATLFMDANGRGRGETFVKDDNNLADNWIGANTVSSVLVGTRSTTPPGAPRPVFPASGASYPQTASITLAWDNPGGAAQYQASLMQGGVALRTSAWSSEPAWRLGSLPAGDYTWQVRARNAASIPSMSAWSASRPLTITPAAFPEASPVSAPFTATMESASGGWAASGLWGQATDDNHTPAGAESWLYGTGAAQGYDTDAPNMGDLTSPPVQLTAQGGSYLRFWYSYQTEGPGDRWDSRWVQLSVDGGPFTNTLQLSGDPAGFWLQSPAIDLSPYAGRQVRVRFHFETLDANRNTYKGWRIDDVTINAAPPPACADAHNDPPTAVAMQYGDDILTEVCPGGDLDYYRFSGSAGDQIGARVQAQSLSSPLDPSLALLDSDGASVLAESDDLVLTSLTDAALTYRLPRTGVYYLRVKAWDHPSAGGPNHLYNLSLYEDGADPTARFTSPTGGASLPTTPISLTVEASDAYPGVSHVEFLWRSGGLLGGEWVSLGEDWDGSDGWAFPFDNGGKPYPRGLAFLARVYDWAGNWYPASVLNVNPPSLKIFLPAVRLR